MICVAALIIFGILGIFSASKRKIAKEALDCVFRRVTLRKCSTGLDKRLKAQITGKLMKKSPKTAKFLWKYFEVFSWLFIILFVWSVAQTGISAYNFYEYGNCNGPNSDEFCLFNPAGNNLQTCTIDGEPATDFSTPDVAPGISFGSKDAPITIIEFGCYICPNTIKVQPEINKIYENYVLTGKARFVYKFVPLQQHEFSEEAALAAFCAANTDISKFWKFHNSLFEGIESEQDIYDKASTAGYDSTVIKECVGSRDNWDAIDIMIKQALDSGVYGTPTLFIEDQVFVGPRPLRVYKRAIERELEQ